MSAETLFAELKRRRVFRVLVGYGVVSFAVLQVVEPIQHALGMSDAVLKFVVVLLGLGFPVAVVLAWAFDVRAGGIERTAPAATWKGTRLGLVLVGIGVLAAAPGLVWVFFLRGGQARDPQPGSAGPQTIAVLPFVNMSGEKDNEYFSDGISEEILNVLAQAPELRVAARTSSFSFKGQSKEVPAIARELEVRMVLEGSVRKQGERVRITAQLIDASTGFHVWSQTYDRELKDIFAIQDEIAHAIARQLKVKLGDAQDLRTTTDLTAYDLYLRGLELWQARGRANLDQAERLFRQAVERDAKFAKAWAGIALVEVLRPDWFGSPMADAYSLARDATEHALALDPALPEAYAAQGMVAANEGRDATGRALFERALAIAPSYATGYQWFAGALLMSGAIDDGLEKAKRATELDPKSAIMRTNYSDGLFYAGRDAEAVKACDTVLAMVPEWPLCLTRKWGVLILRKDFAGGRVVLRKLAAPRGAGSVRFADELMDALEGKSNVRAIAARFLPMPDGVLDLSSPTPLSDNDAILWFMAVGRHAEAITRLERQARQLPHYARLTMTDQHSDPLRCEPRFRAVARQLGFEDARAATVCAGH